MKANGMARSSVSIMSLMPALQALRQRLPARGASQHSVLRCEDEGGEEDQRLQHDDDAAGGAVEEIARIGADEAGRRCRSLTLMTISRGKRSVSR